MSQIDNRVKWCLNKAEKEMRESGRHRGLVEINPDIGLSRQHIDKAEHNLKAMIKFNEAGFSDWSASAGFYSIYHCLLGIIVKHGYESRNQECTFALIYQLIDTGKIELDKKMIEDVHSLDTNSKHEHPTVIELRELGQYGTALSMEDDAYERLLKTVQSVMEQTKLIIETKG